MQVERKDLFDKDHLLKQQEWLYQLRLKKKNVHHTMEQKRLSPIVSQTETKDKNEQKNLTCLYIWGSRHEVFDSLSIKQKNGLTLINPPL